MEYTTSEGPCPRTRRLARRSMARVTTEVDGLPSPHTGTSTLLYRLSHIGLQTNCLSLPYFHLDVVKFRGVTNITIYFTANYNGNLYYVFMIDIDLCMRFEKSNQKIIISQRTRQSIALAAAYSYRNRFSLRIIAT